MIRKKNTAFVNNLSSSAGGIKYGDSILKNVNPQLKAAIKSGNDNLLEKYVNNPNFRSQIGQLIKDIAVESFSTQIGNMINGKSTRVALDMLGHAANGSLELLSYFDHKTQGFTGRSAIKTEAYIYNIFMGQEARKEFKTPPFGHRKQSITLINTETDKHEDTSRSELLTRGGMNQKTIDFLGENTFLTIKDLGNLTNARKEVDAALQLKAAKIIPKKNMDGEVTRLASALRDAYEGKISTERLYAGITGYKTTLYINNDMPNYITYVKIHICTHQNFRFCEGIRGALSPRELVEEVSKTYSTEKTEDHTFRYLKKKDIFPNKRRKKIEDNNFKTLMRVKTNVDITKTEGFREKVKVLRTLTVALKPSDFVKVNLTHDIPYGIDLFDLVNCMMNEASAHTFFIVESVGSTGQVTKCSDQNIKRNGTAPIRLRYNLKMDVNFVAAEKTPDNPLIIKRVEKTNQFEDITLWEQFYGSRGDDFYLNYEDIDIDNNNDKAKFKLDIDLKTNIAESLAVNLQKSMQEKGIIKDLDSIEKLANNGEESVDKDIDEEEEEVMDSEEIMDVFKKWRDEQEPDPDLLHDDV